MPLLVVGACMCVCVCVFVFFQSTLEQLALPWLLWKLYWIPPSPEGKRFKCLCNYTSNNSSVLSGQAQADRDKELQVTQSIWGLLISVTCLSERLEEKQRRLLTHTQGPAIVSTLSESASLYQSSRKCVYRLEKRVFQTPLETHFRQA